jgi:nucleotide-binding universal stress UspA family protein
MKKILLPTDFSPSSLAAYKFAIDFASVSNAELTVMHVIDIPVIQETTFGLQPYLYAKEMFRDAVQNASRIYKRMQTMFPSDVPISFKAIHDDLISGLTEFIRTNHTDLVIMSAHGASQVEEFVSGSQTKRVARHSPVPVLAIPSETNVASIRDIVFPNSLEPDQEHLVQAISSFQRTFNATLHLLFVNTPSNFHTEEESKKLLKSFALYYSLQNFTVNYRYDDTENNGILSFVNEINADLVAMGTHGRTGIAHLLKGSIAETVLQNTNRPVWICKLG